ncbi:FAD-binding oxidoreductase [Sphingobium sp. SCG-1]|nr:FAD-binding oxidoreductase [Sphingobium sp. SCG-1]
MEAVAGLVEELVRIVGPAHVLTGEDVRQRWDGYPPTAPMEAACIVRPADTAQVAAILAYCDAHGLKVVPQGGRTGLVGGARTTSGDVALSLERMRAISPVDVHGSTIEVEAGVPLEAVQEAASAAGFYYPVDLGARGSATIGGTIATNAGGNSVLRYGMTREQVLGLEAVLANGTVLSSMNKLIKNNTGYDLKQMFVGSEGTLGIITRAILRLRPDPGTKATAFVGLAGFDQVLALLEHALSASDGALSSFEVMWPSFVDYVVEEGRHQLPLMEKHSFYVLLEIVSHRSETLLDDVMASAWERGIVADAAISRSVAQSDAFWALRDDIDAMIAALSPVFLYDISLPQSHMATYVEELSLALTGRWSGARLAVFGHIADGNLHVCVHTGCPDDHDEVDHLVYAPLTGCCGSISAEHGIGIEKRAHLGISRSRIEIDVMRQLKTVLDPRGTLNHGKIFS